MKKILEQFINTAYFFMFSITLLWIIRFLNEELFMVIIYLKDFENWLNDSSSFLNIFSLVILPGYLIVLFHIFLGFINKKWNKFFICLGVFIVLTFLLYYISNKVLEEEVKQLNYKQFSYEIKNNLSEQEFIIAKALQDDCKISVKELNGILMINNYALDHSNKYIKVNGCEKLERNDARSILLNLLINKHIIYEK